MSSVPVSPQLLLPASVRDAILEALAKNGNVLRYLIPELRSDKTAVLAAVTQDGLALRFALRMEYDEEVALAAVKQNGMDGTLLLAVEGL